MADAPSPPPSDEFSAEWLHARIQQTYEHLVAARFVMRSLYSPVGGSRLAEFDARLPWSPTSQLAVSGLGAAADHLHAVRVTLEARRLMPYAQLTLVRSALMGAAMTVWVLAPEDDEESWQRALHAEWDEKRHLHNYARLVAQLPTDEIDGKQLEKDLARVSARVEQIQGLASSRFRRTPNMTDDVIPAAAAHTWPDQPAMKTRALLLWRGTSGAAHARAQVLIHGPDVEHRDQSDDGLADHIFGGGMQTIADPYMLAFWLSVSGWRLLERYGGARFAPAVTVRDGLGDPLNPDSPVTQR